MTSLFSTEAIFWCTALLGTCFFLPKVLLMLFGGVATEGMLGAEMDHLDGNEAYSLFSMHSLSGFFMMFGWVGLAASQQYHLSAMWSVLAALLGGSSTLWLVAMLFRFAAKMTSPGAAYRIEESIGKRAMVYQRIPVKGRGVVQISMSGMTREIEAVAEEADVIPSFSDVEILEVVDSHTVKVKPI